MIPKNAIYTGPPSRNVIKFLQRLTMNDSQSRLCFHWYGSLRRLVTDADYADLNALVSEFKRRAV